ncbi:MAG: hypothetical protein K6T65_11770 [Peptococcaceae bacterium]|nr:hypothetical protein [Peptococcaceae bacterium]
MKPIWRPLSGYRTSQNIGFGGGVNTYDPPHLILDNEASSMKNIMPYDAPLIRQRYPATILGSQQPSPIRLLTAYGPTELLQISGGILKRWSSPNWVDVYVGYTANKFSTCNFNGKTLISSQADGMTSYNGSTVSIIAAAPRANYITNHANRVYATGIQGRGKDVDFCALGNEGDWSSTGEAGAGSITVEAPSGENNTGIAALTGGRVVIFKSTSFHELFGTGPTNYEIIDRYYGIGCMAHDTIRTIRGFLYWLGLDGVYRWGGSGVPVKISDPIRDYIPEIFVGGLVYTHVAGTDGRFYFISLGNDIMFAYDTDTGKWWGPLEYGLGSVYTFGRLTGTGDKGLYIGVDTGGTYRIDNPEFSGTVPWEWVSKAYSDGVLSRDKQVLNAIITAEVYSGSTFNVYLSNRIRNLNDGKDWYLVKSTTAEDLPQKVKVYISPTLMQPSEFYRIKLTGSGRVDIYGFDKEFYVNPRN